MPPYTNLQHFMSLVKSANPNYERHTSSSLHAIVASLQSSNPDRPRIQTLVNNLANDKKQKYKNALSYLDTNFLSPRPTGGIAVGPRVPVVAPPRRNVTPQQQAPPAGGPQIPGGVIHDATGDFHGWTEITNLTQLGAGAPNRAGDALSVVQRPKITAMLRTVKTAVDLSLKTLRSTVPGARDSRAALFEELFGPCTNVTKKTVTDNYAEMEVQLFGARGLNATGVAVLNEAARGNNNFAETYRRSTFRPVGGQIALILGSGFFRTAMGVGSAFRANDFTIGTLVHEFSHACFDASDIPEAEFLQTGSRLDRNGFPPASGTSQCVDGQQDRQLVAWIFGRPWTWNQPAAPPPPAAAQVTEYSDYPLRNADAYGQYSLELVVRNLQRTA